MRLSTWFFIVAVVISVLVVLRRLAVAWQVSDYNSTNVKARIGLSRMVLRPFRPWLTLLLWIFWLVLYASDK